MSLSASASAQSLPPQLTESVPVPESEPQPGFGSASETVSKPEPESTVAAPRNAPSSKRAPRKQRCRFFGSKKGCRAGDACPFAHVISNAQSNHAAVPKPADIPPQTPVVDSTKSIQNGHSSSAIPAQSASNTVPPAQPASRVVSRPVPRQQIQDPRAFQISQIQKRFSAKQEKTVNDADLLLFSMNPSDPDFPFEIDALKCALEIPLAFPQTAPALRISNKEMERGFQLNVERGFDTIWNQLTQPTLLKAMNALDKRLEELLTAKKAETVKIVLNTRTTTNKSKPSSSTPAKSIDLPELNSKKPKNPVLEPPSAERQAQADARRRHETEILQRRLGRTPGFAKEGNGTIFTIPIEPRKTKDMSAELQAVKLVHLFVPLQYDCEPCTIELLGVSSDVAGPVERAFAKRAIDHPELPLLAQINYLVQNMQVLASQGTENISSRPVEHTIPQTESSLTEEPQDGVVDPDRSHIRFIPRPPEWSNGPEEIGDTDDSSYTDTSTSASDDDYDDEYDDEDDNMPSSSDPSNAVESNAPRERGIMLSFPSLSMYNIELLEPISVHLSLKCDRCKTAVDISNIRPVPNLTTTDPSDQKIHNPTPAQAVTIPCKKCSSSLSIAFRPDLIHANSTRAGYLDLDGCTPLDILHATFTPTCSACSTPSTNSLTTARGAPATINTCRTCHAKLSLSLPDAKFLRVGGASANLHDSSLPRKKAPREQLGIVAGTPLPRHGACSHYAKSHRWFRFGCCGRVFPCDRCHDAEVPDHLNEFASRMICGYCSREQVFRPEACALCKAPLTGRVGRGFWEGGKGTRDRAKMSRKEPRKYKRRGGTAVGKAAKAKKT